MAAEHILLFGYFHALLYYGAQQPSEHVLATAGCPAGGVKLFWLCAAGFDNVSSGASTSQREDRLTVFI
jgi:hypothetical protein